MSPITLAITLAIIVEGNQRIVHVSDLTSDYNVLSSSKGDSNFTCCVYGSCSCNSLDIALSSLTSNVLINITTDVKLSSFIEVSDLENISIIGYNNPTVNCKNIGGMHLNLCYNCIIEGINWYGCGSDDSSNNTEPGSGLKLSYSSNILIQNCAFLYSIGRLVVLLKSINVTIIHGRFVNNKGICIHVINQKLYFNGMIFFQNNTSQNDSKIHISDHSTVIFSENSNVTFLHNFAYRGGAIFLTRNSNIIFDHNSTVKFTKNTALIGTIYAEASSNVIFTGCCKVTFNNNLANFGAAIYSFNKSHITFMGSSNVTFNKNRERTISSISYSLVCFKGNSSAMFYKNSLAISLYDKCTVSFEENSTIKFHNNLGAIHIEEGTVYFEENSKSEFSNNVQRFNGASIYLKYGCIYFRKNSIAIFNNSKASFGGAISLSFGCISFEGNSFTLFHNNTVRFAGGAIYTVCSNLTFVGKSITKFSNNTVLGSEFSSKDRYGNFSDNTVFRFDYLFKESEPSHSYPGGGGAICSINKSYITFGENSSTNFNLNRADGPLDKGGYYGGAVVTKGNSFIIFLDNSSVAFAKNKAKFGANIYSFNDCKIVATEDSRVTFNGFLATWCANGCLPFTGQDNDFVIIDSNGIVWCNNNKAFTCHGKKCHCKKLEDILVTTAKVSTTHIEDRVLLLSSFIILNNFESISIIGYNKRTAVLCTNGSLSIMKCNNLLVEGITWVGCGDFSTFVDQPVLSINSCNDVTIENCSFQTSMGIAIKVDDVIENVNISYCNFTNNNYSSIKYITTKSPLKINGCHFNNNTGAKIVSIKFELKFDSLNPLTISDCYFSYNVVARIFDMELRVKFEKNDSHNPLTINDCYFSYNEASTIVRLTKMGNDLSNFPDFYLINSNFHNNRGISVFLDSYAIHMHIIGKVLFENNVAWSGTGIYSFYGNRIIFAKDSDIKFISNLAEDSGAAIFLTNSNITFEDNSRVEFNNNKAIKGTIYSNRDSKVLFTATCQVIFSGNSVTQYGAAIFSKDYSHITFTGSSKVIFRGNVVSSSSKDLRIGGTIYCIFGDISFEEDSVTTFMENSADFGAAILSGYISRVTFKGRTKVMFNNNTARYCGVFTLVLFSRVDFYDIAEVIYINNTVLGVLDTNNYYESSPESAGTICTLNPANLYNLDSINSDFAIDLQINITFSGNSSTTFINNKAVRGGAAVFTGSNITIEEYAKVIINNNIAERLYGGGFACLTNSTITCKDNAYVIFKGNKAIQSAGAIYKCKIIFKDNSVVEFINNSAGGNGGAIATSQQFDVTFEGNTRVTFDNNKAENGGVFYFTNSTITFTDFSVVLFSNNIAKRSSGVGHFSLNSKVLFQGSTTVRFTNNLAEQNAGVLYSVGSYISFKENSSLTLLHNTAVLNGGALYFDFDSNIIFTQFTKVKFAFNKAFRGGAILANDNSRVIFRENSILLFTKNSAVQYGGAIVLDINAVMINHCSSENCVNFIDNIANVLGDSVYQNTPKLCNNSCYNKNINVTGISHKFISTSPKELKFTYPAICIDKDSAQCNYYYVKNIMLGTEIAIPACVLDYYNHSVESTQFLLQGDIRSNYYIRGPKQVLMSCDVFKGISIMGNLILARSINFSINITLNTLIKPTWRQITVCLIVELSPCHLGFWHYPKSLKCECYNATDIVFCFDTTSTIKRGYWFGSVTGKPTVTLCPISYCNFTCCETSNGYYHLSTVRDNQCRSHRTGTACGRCTNGFTLSFDSPECVRKESCTVGKTVAVILLTLAYWIIIVALVFAMMYYKVGICYLYSITYYYSIVDILLNQNLQASRGLDITVNIISSFSKITPQFLGGLCLTTGMSGIDQQFIHYMHPLAIIVILVIITLSARRSQRISNIIRRGIIHVICLLLLLSYTSMASTSLLLMRPLKFHDIDKVYTYLSPDIEYFHGRHLTYSIVALLCAISIVIGLPLLLILEPFLNRKINFIKIKPLLDQFQGNYKGKCRCFAGYYMICRLLIILIVISNSSNDFFISYILVTICGMIALIHQTIKPYANNEILNRFDGLILQLIIFIAALPLPENLESPIVIFVLITLPLLVFIAMTLFLNRCNLKKIITYVMIKMESTSNDDDGITDNGASNYTELREFKTIIVDDSKRKNAIICDV